MGTTRSRVITTVAVGAALIYNSWPLGYVLNPQVAYVGFSSDLEAYGQPYNWLFISGDVLCGMLIAGAVLYLFRGRILHSVKADLLSLGLFFFALMTAVSAVLPLRCGMDIRTCGYHTGQPFGLHDVIGAIADLGLFIALVAAWRSSRGDIKRARMEGVVLLVWSIWGATFLLTPLPIVQNLPNLQSIAVAWQQIFLLLSGVGIVTSMRCLESLRSSEGE